MSMHHKSNMFQWLLAAGFLLVAVSAADADHWTKWFKPGMQNTGGKRSTNDLNMERLFNYRISRPTIDSAGLYDKFDHAITAELMKTSRDNLMGLLRALAQDAVAKENGEYSNNVDEWTNRD